MKKNYTAALKVFAAGLCIIFVTSCPSPITEALVAAVEDSFLPTITITSPEYASNYLSEVTITGRVEDNAISQGDAKGSLSAISFTAGSQSTYRGGISVSSDGTVEKVDNLGDVDINLDIGTGEFSFTMQTALFRGPMQIEISATDRNNNVGTTMFLLYESSGPVVKLISPAIPVYAPKSLIHIEGTIGDSILSPDTITDIDTIVCTLAGLGIDGENSIILNVADELASPEPFIEFRPEEGSFQNFVFRLEKASGTFTTDINTYNFTSPITINITATDRNGHPSELSKTLVLESGEVLMVYSMPDNGGYFSPTQSNFPIDASIDTTISPVTELWLTAAWGPEPQTSEQIQLTPLGDFWSGGQSIAGFVDLSDIPGLPGSGSVKFSLTAVVNDIATTDSITIVGDDTLPTLDITKFAVSGSSSVGGIGIDEDLYAHGEEIATLEFNIYDGVSGEDINSLQVTIGDDLDPFLEDLGNRKWRASSSLPSRSGADPNWDGGIVPFTVSVKDMVQNSVSKNQGLMPEINYYHAPPTNSGVTLRNLGNVDYPDIIRDTETITIGIDNPVGRIVNSSSSDIDIYINDVLNGRSDPDSFVIGVDVPSGSSGSVGYTYNYADMAGNIAFFDFSGDSIMMVDNVPPEIRTGATYFSSVGNDDWATDVPTERLQAVFYTDDNTGNAFNNITDQPIARFYRGITEIATDDATYSVGTGAWTSEYTVTDSTPQGNITCTLEAWDQAGNPSNIYTFPDPIIVDTEGPDVGGIEFRTDGNGSVGNDWWARSGQNIQLYFTLDDTIDGVLDGLDFGGPSQEPDPRVYALQSGNVESDMNVGWDISESKWLATISAESLSDGEVGYRIEAWDTHGIVTTGDVEASMIFTDSQVNVDNTDPGFGTITISTDNGVSGYVGVGEIITVAVVIDDDNPDAANVTINDTPGEVYEVIDGDTDIAVDIEITDLAGNSYEVIDYATLIVDDDIPGIVFVEISDLSDTYADGEEVTIGFIVTDTQPDENLLIDVATSDGGGDLTSAEWNTDQDHWEFVYTVNDETPSDTGTVTITIDIDDSINDPGSEDISLNYDNP